MAGIPAAHGVSVFKNVPFFSAFLLLVTSLTLFLVTLFSARWRTEGTGNRRVYCV